MKLLLIASGALAFASSALAQTTTGTTPAPVQAPPGESGTMTSGTTTTPPDPKAIIASEFPTYDKDGNGSLSTAEFDAWMMALKEKSGGAAMSAAEKSTWLKGAFAAADTDKNKVVSQTELTTYLTAGT